METVSGLSDVELYGNLLVENTAEQLGIKDIAAVAAVLAGQRVLPTRGKLGGAPRGTSIASKYLSKIPGELPVGVPTVTRYPKVLGGKGMRIAVTKSIGRIAGRAVPFVGWGILAYDAGVILYNTQAQYNQILQTR